MDWKNHHSPLGDVERNLWECRKSLTKVKPGKVDTS